MLWRDAAIDQMVFMRDVIGRDICHVPMFVVSTHRSKSIDLPVYGFVMRNGIKVIARENFYGWVVSIELPQNLPAGYLDMDMFSKYNLTLPYCEGFMPEWVYDIYDPGAKSCTKFTVGISDNYKFYMIMYMLNKAFKPLNMSDNRSVDEIGEAIHALYTSQGFFNEDYDNKPAGWEILWNTYFKMSCLTNHAYGVGKTSENPMEFAKQIKKYPELLNEFLLEEYMYNTKF